MADLSDLLTAELRAESKILLEDSNISRTDLEAMMRSVMPDSET